MFCLSTYVERSSFTYTEHADVCRLCGHHSTRNVSIQVRDHLFRGANGIGYVVRARIPYFFTVHLQSAQSTAINNNEKLKLAETHGKMGSHSVVRPTMEIIGIILFLSRKSTH